MAGKLILSGHTKKAISIDYYLNGVKIATVEEFSKIICAIDEGGILVAKNSSDGSLFGSGVRIEDKMETYAEIGTTDYLCITLEIPFHEDQKPNAEQDASKKSKEEAFFHESQKMYTKQESTKTKETILAIGSTDDMVKKVIIAMFILSGIALFFFFVLLDDFEPLATLLMGLGVLMLVLAFWLLLSCCGQKMVVTNKRVYTQKCFSGITTIPLDAIGTVRIYNFVGGIYVSSFSGHRVFCLNITHREKIYEIICNLLIARQKGNE